MPQDRALKSQNRVFVVSHYDQRKKVTNKRRSVIDEPNDKRFKYIPGANTNKKLPTGDHCGVIYVYRKVTL